MSIRIQIARIPTVLLACAVTVLLVGCSSGSEIVDLGEIDPAGDLAGDVLNAVATDSELICLSGESPTGSPVDVLNSRPVLESCGIDRDRWFFLSAEVAMANGLDPLVLGCVQYKLSASDRGLDVVEDEAFVQSLFEECLIELAGPNPGLDEAQDEFFMGVLNPQEAECVTEFAGRPSQNWLDPAVLLVCDISVTRWTEVIGELALWNGADPDVWECTREWILTEGPEDIEELVTPPGITDAAEVCGEASTP